MSTRFTIRCAFLIGLVAIGCQGKTRAAAPATTPVAPAAGAAPAANPGLACHPMTDFDGKDPYGLGLELCTEPLPPGSGSQISITLRRVADQKVLWMEAADSVAQDHILDGQSPPALQVVIVHEVSPQSEDDTEEDAVYVIDFEYVDGAINEVNRFRDSGD